MRLFRNSPIDAHAVIVYHKCMETANTKFSVDKLYADLNAETQFILARAFHIGMVMHGWTARGDCSIESGVLRIPIIIDGGNYMLTLQVDE